VGEIIGYFSDAEAAAAGDAAVQAAPVATPDAGATPAAVAAPRIMPAAARVLATEAVDADAVHASGPGGRVLKEDAVRAVAAPTPPLPPPAPFDAGREEEAVPMSPLRLRIAQRLVAAQAEAALLTTFNEVDMSAVMALRHAHQEAFTARHGVKLGFMSFFVKAAVDALKTVPAVNASLRDRDIVYHNYCDIGVAIGGGKGLVVPVLRNAERLGFAEIEKAIGDFATRARDGRITLEELAGGTFSISNGGVYGSMLSTPIVNPPQSAILGLHAINDRPMARDGQVVIAPMMYVALTYDHRVIDGREAVTFLRRIKEVIEQPARLMLEV
jgi:2-oxoglutarate dehydrogenase E2 component (dihydrolipoamide succinyltransferase)